MEEVQQVKQKNNFHALCLLLCERFKFTDKQAEKRANEIIQLGINQFQTENQNIILDLRLRRHLIEGILSLVINKLNKEIMDSFEDLQIYIYTRDFEEMTEAVLGSTKKELETIPPAKAESSKRSNAQKQADRKYHSSIKGRATYLKYIHSEKGQTALAKYRKSDRGKETIARAIAKYQSSAKGKEAIARAIKKYSETDRGREKRREAVRAYRQRQRDKSILATGGIN
jgi:hypothetical protein